MDFTKRMTFLWKFFFSPEVATEGGVSESNAEAAISVDSGQIEKQKNELKELLKKPLKRDDKWFE